MTIQGVGYDFTMVRDTALSMADRIREEAGRRGVSIEPTGEMRAPLANGPVLRPYRVHRPHREIDVTNYGDTYRKIETVQSGVNITDIPDEGVALLLGALMVVTEIPVLRRYADDQRKKYERESAAHTASDAQVLAMWDTMRKQTRKRLPKETYEYAETLAAKRDANARDDEGW